MANKKLKENSYEHSGQHSEELYAQLERDEKALVDAMYSIIGVYGRFGDEDSTVYVNYTPASENEDAAIGVKCGNCVFHRQTEEGLKCVAINAEIQANGICRLAMIPPGYVMSSDEMQEAAPGALKVGNYVRWKSSGGTAQGQISRIVRDGKIKVPNSSFTITGTEEDPAALITVWKKNADGWAATDTKVGHKFSTLSQIKPLKASEALTEAEKYKVPEGVKNAAQRAVKWISEGKAGDGFTSTGRRRAAQLAAGGSVSRDTVARMKSFLSRHQVDKKAEGFSAGEAGYPSPGRVAYDAWGGDAGYTWTKGIKLD